MSRSHENSTCQHLLLCYGITGLGVQLGHYLSILGNIGAHCLQQCMCIGQVVYGPTPYYITGICSTTHSNERHPVTQSFEANPNCCASLLPILVVEGSNLTCGLVMTSPGPSALVDTHNKINDYTTKYIIISHRHDDVKLSRTLVIKQIASFF